MFVVMMVSYWIFVFLGKFVICRIDLVIVLVLIIGLILIELLVCGMFLVIVLVMLVSVLLMLICL